jgi:citrate synthase
MGQPEAMLPVLLAIPPTVGRHPQWQEMITDPEQKIARPRQIFLGQPRRELPKQKA